MHAHAKPLTPSLFLSLFRDGYKFICNVELQTFGMLHAKDSENEWNDGTEERER